MSYTGLLNILKVLRQTTMALLLPGVYEYHQGSNSWVGSHHPTFMCDLGNPLPGATGGSSCLGSVPPWP